MKKLILLAMTLGLYGNAWAQGGEITFANRNTSLVVTNNGFTMGSAAISAGYEVQIFYQPASNPAPAPISFSSGNLGSWEAMLGSPVVSINPLRGLFDGGTETTGSDVPPDGSVWFEVVAWDGGFGSLSAAETSGTADFGESTIWSQATGSGAPGSPVVIDGANEFSGVILDVPEPSVLALSSVGGAVLLLRRRK